MAKTTIECSSISVSIQNFVGSKGIDFFPAQIGVVLVYERYEDGAPCKIRLLGGDSEDAREFNAFLSHYDGNLAVQIWKDEATSMKIVLPEEVEEAFITAKTDDIVEGAFLA